jgi:hypothetical protein
VDSARCADVPFLLQADGNFDRAQRFLYFRAVMAGVFDRSAQEELSDLPLSTIRRTL